MMPGKWIGRGVPIAWPPTSTDLTSWDSFLSGFVKNILYWVKDNNLEQFKSHIMDAVATATHNMLQNMGTDVKYHLDICHATRDAHI
jgi:hypothetical protein